MSSPSTPRPAASPKAIFGVVAVGVVLATLDLFIVNIAFPDIEQDFGTSVSDVSWVLNAYAIVFAALLVPFGKLGDILGRRRVFVTGLTVFAVGSGLCAAAGSVELLVAARVLQAIGAAAVTPTSLGLLLPAFPPEKRPAVIGGWAALGAVGAAAGPPLGGLLTELSWHWIFIVNVPLALPAAVAAVRVLPEIRDPDRPALPDALGSVLLIAAVTLLTLGLVRGPAWDWDLRVVACFVAAVALTVAFALRSARHASPVLELSILRVRAFALSSVAAALFFAAFASMLLSNVIFLTSVWGYSALEAGFALTPGPLAAAVLAPIAGRLAARVGPGRVGGIGSLVFALASLWWIWLIGLEPDYVVDFLPGMLIGGAGVGLVLPSFTVAAAATLPPARLATGIGAQTMFRQVGAALGVSAFVAILGTPARDQVLGAFDDTRIFMVAAAAAGALVLFAVPRRSAAARGPAGAGAPQPVPERTG